VSQYVHPHEYMDGCILMYTHTNLCVSQYVYTYEYMDGCIHMYTHTHLCVYQYVYTYEYMDGCKGAFSTLVRRKERVMAIADTLFIYVYTYTRMLTNRSMYISIYGWI